MRTGSFGKPCVAEGDLRFSLSHSRGLALYAVARGLEVGCDLEFRDPRLACGRVAERFFSPPELHALRSLPAERWAEGFFNGWTRKEAYVKARGLGLSLPLDSFAVTLAPRRARRAPPRLRRLVGPRARAGTPLSRGRRRARRRLEP